MYYFPKGPLSLLFFPSSPFYSLLLSLFTLAAFILLPKLRTSTTQTEKGTHWKRKRRKKKKHLKRERKKRVALFHTHLHLQRGIYRHRGPYFRMLSAGGPRLQETQDEFSSASFHHTAMTPLFTSSIYLHTDCLPPQLARVRVVLHVCQRGGHCIWFSVVGERSL